MFRNRGRIKPGHARRRFSLSLAAEDLAAVYGKKGEENPSLDRCGLKPDSTVGKKRVGDRLGARLFICGSGTLGTQTRSSRTFVQGTRASVSTLRTMLGRAVGDLAEVCTACRVEEC